MTATPLVTAIVSTYASERFIRGCLDDLVAQTLGDRLEIIVIDAASPENEGAIVAEYAARHANIRYIRTPEREPLYAAWNRGVAEARGRYVTNANADDRHRRDALEILAGVLDRDPFAALAYGDTFVTTRENATFENAPKYARFRWPDFDRRLLFECGIAGPQPMWRRELHATYGGFDESFVVAGDYEWWLRLAAAGERFVHVAEPLGVYLASRGSVEHRDPSRLWRESEAARERHWRAEWGPRPRPHGVYLRFDLAAVARHTLRGDLAPLRDAVAHARMLVTARLGR